MKPGRDADLFAAVASTGPHSDKCEKSNVDDNNADFSAFSVIFSETHVWLNGQ